ncbi:transcription initiation factor TFIID subunit 4 isoform X1 [Canis lupus familiaris]|uniref:transcription initiation factor TFIID subunit 4 isoform X1 n=1 Tax=Canis lupus familiaris TaxID=9615 RepID=UPI0018F6C3AF|nr:transcription initiation factor TFIID subunit 4 isoform X1 [Canis lupus familiaris]
MYLSHRPSVGRARAPPPALPPPPPPPPLSSPSLGYRLPGRGRGLRPGGAAEGSGGAGAGPGRSGAGRVRGLGPHERRLRRGLQPREDGRGFKGAPQLILVIRRRARAPACCSGWAPPRAPGARRPVGQPGASRRGCTAGRGGGLEGLERLAPPAPPGPGCRGGGGGGGLGRARVAARTGRSREQRGAGLLSPTSYAAAVRNPSRSHVKYATQPLSASSVWKCATDSTVQLRVWIHEEGRASIPSGVYFPSAVHELKFPAAPWPAQLPTEEAPPRALLKEESFLPHIPRVLATTSEGRRCADGEKAIIYLQASKRGLRRNQPCWHLHLRLPTSRIMHMDPGANLEGVKCHGCGWELRCSHITCVFSSYMYLPKRNKNYAYAKSSTSIFIASLLMMETTGLSVHR